MCVGLGHTLVRPLNRRHTMECNIAGLADDVILCSVIGHVTLSDCRTVKLIFKLCDSDCSMHLCCLSIRSNNMMYAAKVSE